MNPRLHLKNKITSAKKKKQPTIRLTYSEAEQITEAIAKLENDLRESQRALNTLERNIHPSQQAIIKPSTVDMDGGKF